MEDVAQVLGGGTPSRTEQSYFGGGIAWATPPDITKLDRLYIRHTKETVSEEGLRNSSTKLMPAGAVLLTSRATIGFTAVSTVLICTNQGFINFICGPDLVPEYLAYWLRTQRDKMIQRAGGTTFKEIARGTLRKFEIPVPPLAEQRRIVDLLSRAEGIVRLRREAEKKAAELIPALFLDMFGDPATNPKGWPVVSVGQIATYTRYGPRFPDRQYSEEGAHILRTTDMGYSGELRWHDSPMLPMSNAELEKYALYPGTLLITRTGATIGKTALFKGSDRPCIAGAYLIEVGLCSDVAPEYVLHCFLGQYGQSCLVSGSRAVAQPNINAPTICAIPIPLPDLSIQKAFAERVNGIESIQSQQATATAKAQATFDALLASVFNGHGGK